MIWSCHRCHNRLAASSGVVTGNEAVHSITSPRRQYACPRISTGMGTSSSHTSSNSRMRGTSSIAAMLSGVNRRGVFPCSVMVGPLIAPAESVVPLWRRSGHLVTIHAVKHTWCRRAKPPNIMGIGARHTFQMCRTHRAMVPSNVATCTTLRRMLSSIPCSFQFRPYTRPRFV